METNIRHLETLSVLTLFAAVFAFIYPDLFFLKASPMGGDPSTLKDPTVSWLAFIPAFREFRYELLEHGNLLWSNLRGMGQPILGNTVQGAPLFPLNLILLPLPDQLYWSVMPISRICLICLAAFLIARRIIGMPFAASLLFGLLIGFNVNTVRWINHPWSNGLLAGLWYFYFVCRSCLAATPLSKTWVSIGLIISVFAMVTSGFPEATIMSALIVGVLFIGFAASYWSTLIPKLTHIIGLLLVCHVIGFALSSIQLFSLLEFIYESGAMDLRSGFAGGSYKAEDLLPYSLAQLSFFGVSAAQQSLLTFSMGLWGLFFAIRGVLAVLTGNIKPVDGRYTGFAIAFLVLMVIFVVKAFGLSETLNTLFLSTPILAQSHFPLYFSPLFFIGFAFFAALGLAELVTDKKNVPPTNFISFVSSLVAAFAVICFSLMAIKHFHGMNLWQTWEVLFSKPELLSLKIFIIGSITVLLLQLSKVVKPSQTYSNSKPLIWVLSAVLLVVSIVEIGNTVPKNFSPKDFRLLGVNQNAKNAIYQAYSNAPVPRHELRGTNLYGDFAGQGLATADNGASAILPPQNRLLRIALFRVPFGGYMPLKGPRASWSYQAMSANILSVHATPKSYPDWKGYKLESEIESKITLWPMETQTLSNPLFFEGRSTSHLVEHRGVSVWLHFQAKESLTGQLVKSSNDAEKALDDFWIEANLASQNVVGKHKDRQIVEVRWRIRVPADWLAHDNYTVTLRQIDTFRISFHDAPPVTLSLDREHPDAKLGERLQLLSSSVDDKQHFLFDKGALPRAYIASACSQAETIEQEMDFYRRDNSVMKGEVIFPFNETQTSVPCESYKNDFKRVAITDDKQSDLSFEPIQGPALLFLNDSEYPGWKAYDGEHELTIERANSNGRSVYLPDAREYSVQMIYAPSWLTWVYGLLILAIALLALLYRMIWMKKIK